MDENEMDRCPNEEEEQGQGQIPDLLATLKEDLQNLSGKKLDSLLERWKEVLFGDPKHISLILLVFSEVGAKINGITPMADNFLFLDFLAQLKQELFSCDVFSYGEELYGEYMEGIYRAAGHVSYYLKPAFLEKYVKEEVEKYEEVRRILEEHYNGDIAVCLQQDLQERVGYLPSKEEIDYLLEQAQAFVRIDANMDKALFFLYRVILLSLKRLIDLEEEESMRENEELLRHLLNMSTVYQLALDEKHALDILEYAQKLAVEELAVQKLIGQDLDTEEEIQDTYGELRREILRKQGHIKRELYFNKKKVTKEEVLSVYQEALALSEAIFGKESSQAEEVRKDIVWFQANSGEQEKIAVLLEQLKKAKEEEDIDAIESLHGIISEVYKQSGDFESAILHYQIKVRILINEYGEDSDVAADAYNEIGELYEEAERYTEAGSCYRHALANYKEYLLRTQEEDADDPETILMNYEECLYHTGRIYQIEGNYENALSHFQEALDIFDSRCEYAGIERANYLKAMAETYEKMQFMGRAEHYYLWAWDTYQTIAEFNRLREKNASLFESETEECEEKAEQVRLHMKEIGLNRMICPVEEIAYLELNQEEQNYFLKRFGQLVRKRLKEEDIWKNWIFQWKVYYRICMEWQERTEVIIPSILEEAFSMLQRYLKKESDDKELIKFSERFFAHLSQEEYEDEWEEEYSGFYYALGDFFHAVLESDTDFRSFQILICEQLPLWAEVFSSVYCKEEEKYSEYEKTLRYKQAVSSSVFAKWIKNIQKDIRRVLACKTEEELW